MEIYFYYLQKMYNNVLEDAVLTKDSHGCAALLNPSVFSQCAAKNNELCATHVFPKLDAPISSGPDLVNDTHDVSENFSHLKCHVQEIKLLQLTLIKMMLAKLQCQEVADGIKLKYLEIMRILEESNIDSELIQLLCSLDKQLSHLACKSLVSLVHFQLTEENLLNSAWFAFCFETLSGFPSSSWIAECLWTLTNTIKEVLKDGSSCKEGNLKKLLTPIDTVLERFYSSILSYYSTVPQDISLSAQSTNNLNAFLDLLELLVASRFQVPLNLGCQRMLFFKSDHICILATSPVHDLIKKKSIMLLRKCMLCNAGEDLGKIKWAPSSYRDPHFDSDCSALAATILQIVNSEWLNKLSTGGTVSHFDGSMVDPQAHPGSNSDLVILRSLSLLLLRALETKIQDSACIVESQAHLESAMCPLLTFLKRHLRPSAGIRPFEHSCLWLSLFVEQDDDMLEAAKSLLSIYLKFKRFWRDASFTLCRSDAETRDKLSHRNGFNPHCIFLFLLSNIAFDATVILDFLISSETCFLEYFVQYLKLLIKDWHEFVKVSKWIQVTLDSDFRVSGKNLSWQDKYIHKSDLTMQSTPCDLQTCTDTLLTPSLTFSALLHRDSHSEQTGGSDFSSVQKNSHLLGGLQKLVDYDSSEDSDRECTGEDSLIDVKQATLNSQTTTNTTVDDNAEITKQNVLCLIQQDVNVSASSGCKISSNTFVSADDIFQKATVCFQELQNSVSRLHGRNLFPYNPNALLKLLNQVNTISKEQRSASKCKDTKDSSLV